MTRPTLFTDENNVMAPARTASAVVTDTPFGAVSRAIYVGGTGAVSAVMSDGSTVVFSGVQAGTILPIRAIEVNTSGTDATDMVALF